MRPTNLYPQGILLDGGEKKGLFKWELIKHIGVGHIGRASSNGDCVRIVDLIYAVDASVVKLIRIRESMIEYTALFDPPPENRMQGFTTFVRMLLQKTTAPTIPASLRDTIPGSDISIPEFGTIEEYEAGVRNALRIDN
jgi:hypothetical protein